MTFLADTNIIGELTRKEPNSGVLAWARQVTTLTLSAVTVEEIFYGLSWKPSSRVHAHLSRILQNRCTILPVTAEIARIAGNLRGQFQADGATRQQADMLIAATAQVHRLTLVTHNVRDFSGCGVPVLDPFD